MPPESPTPSNPPLVTLFSANPSSLTPLDLEGELDEITTELDASGLEGLLRFESRPVTTPRAVQRALVASRATVVQFSGHGRGGEHARPRANPTRNLVPDPAPSRPTGIMLHGERGSSVSVVSGAALGELFAKVGSSVRLVFLSACHSAEQVDAIVAHVDFVIGIDGAITDQGAKAFAVALYRALALGRTIEEAFDLGVNALSLEGFEADVELPRLRARRGADPTTTRLLTPPVDADGKAWDVFVAYNHEDREPVAELVEELHHRHLRVFYDEWEIGAGDEVRQRLEHGLEGSTHGLMALSPTTMSRPWVQAEYTALFEKAMVDGKLLIPVLVGRGDTKLPPFLRARQPVDLRGVSPEEFREQVGVIARAIRGQRPGPPPRSRRRGRPRR